MNRPPTSFRGGTPAYALRLQAAGASAKPRLGQHFLVDRAVLAAIIEAAAVTPGERVVEVGPGPGILTEALLAAGARVTAFEYDQEYVQVLRGSFATAIDAGGLTLVPGDALTTVPPLLASLVPYAVVANIPYQITTPLLRLFLEPCGQPRPDRLVLLVQREVGERLAARPGQAARGYLSVLCQYYAEATVIRTVPPQAFWPAPKVNSVVLTLSVRSSRALPDEEEAAFFRMVHTYSQQPRKQLKNVIAATRRLPMADVAAVLDSINLPTQVRAHELGEADWVRLWAWEKER